MDDLVDRLREVTGEKLNYTNTPNSLRLAAADRIEELEAKLAKAVEALKCWNNMMQNDAYDLGEMVSEFDSITRTTLAELKVGISSNP